MKTVYISVEIHLAYVQKKPNTIWILKWTNGPKCKYAEETSKEQ